MIHEHSREAYREEKDSGRLSKRHQLILTVLADGSRRTDREIKDALGFSEMNSVRPRITEMVGSGHLAEVGSTRCRTTRKTVRLVSLPTRQLRMAL